MFDDFLVLDAETKSVLDVREVGAPRYTADLSTRVLMISYAQNDGSVQLWQAHEGPMPSELARPLRDPRVRKLAWNVGFEFRILRDCLKIDIPIEEWFDIAVLARYVSLPGKLEKAGPILGLAENEAKMTEGKELIRMFSSPVRMGGEETLFGVTEPFFNSHENKPGEWKRFCDYCVRDTEVERRIFRMLEPYMLPEEELENWYLDQKINETGTPVNITLVKTALGMADANRAQLVEKFKEMTGLANPNSPKQLLPWLKSKGYPHESLNKTWVTRALANPVVPAKCKKALLFRQESSKTSYKKFESILNRVSEDGRLRDMFQFMGAGRTGRWSGHGVQFQNLPRPTKVVEKNLERALDLISQKDTTTILSEFVAVNPQINEKIPSVIGTITSCIRSVFQAEPGETLAVCDLNAIENRVLGWLAGCEAILDVFRQGRDPYLDFAEKMYKIPYERLIKVVNGKHKPLDSASEEKRQIAKPAVLGCGYGLSHGTELTRDGQRVATLKKDKWGNVVKTGLIAYAENMGVKLTPTESYLAVTAFRDAYPEVVQLWRDYENAAVAAVRDGERSYVGFVDFSRRDWVIPGQNVLIATLPSGRNLHYLNVRMETKWIEGKDGLKEKCPICKNRRYKVKDHQHGFFRDTLIYDGIGHGTGATTDKIEWAPVYTSGMKLTENFDQAISRDALVYGMRKADQIGMSLVLHVHDEAGAVVQDGGFLGLPNLQHCLSMVPKWAPGLLLAAEGYEGRVYKKS